MTCHGVVLCHQELSWKELSWSCLGVAQELSSVIKSCHGVDRELSWRCVGASSVIRSCHGVVRELSSNSRLSSRVVLELSRSCPLS